MLKCNLLRAVCPNASSQDSPKLFLTLSSFPSEPQNDISVCVSSISKLDCSFHEIRPGLSGWLESRKCKVGAQVPLSSGERGLPCGLGGKESTWNEGAVGAILGSRRSPGEGNGNPLQYSRLENPMRRGAWWAMRPRGHKGLDVVGQLTSTRAYTRWFSSVPPPAVPFMNTTWKASLCQIQAHLSPFQGGVSSKQRTEPSRVLLPEGTCLLGWTL